MIVINDQCHFPESPIVMIYQDPDFEVHADVRDDETVIIRLPESGKHPRHVLDVADELLIQAVEQRKQLCIHTHSEHLMLRVLRRIRETKYGEHKGWPAPLRAAYPDGVSPRHVTALYVQAVEVLELPITLDGGFSRPWPGGFFTEQLSELS